MEGNNGKSLKIYKKENQKNLDDGLEQCTCIEVSKNAATITTQEDYRGRGFFY